jgi:hypothetical protein
MIIQRKNLRCLRIILFKFLSNPKYCEVFNNKVILMDKFSGAIDFSAECGVMSHSEMNYE